MKRIPDISQELRIRFWSGVSIGDVDSCWEWKKSTNYSGYGKFCVTRKSFFRSHRIAYFLYYGIDPDILDVLHSCDNRKCCNPNHLRLGTPADNCKDKVASGNSCRGEKHWKAKLSADDVRNIRELRGKVLGRVLAEQYNVPKLHIYGIQNRRYWKHI